MRTHFLMLPSRAICVIAFALAMAVVFGGCSTQSDGTSGPAAPNIVAPLFFVGVQEQVDIMVTSDKDDYWTGETSHFTVAIYKNGELWESNTALGAWFPWDCCPVSLTHVSHGVYSYDAVLPNPGVQTFFVSISHNYDNAIAAVEEKIARLEGEIADLEDQLAGETDPNKQSVLQSKIDQRISMIDMFEDKIANMEEPMAYGVKLIYVTEPEEPPPGGEDPEEPEDPGEPEEPEEPGPEEPEP